MPWLSSLDVTLATSPSHGEIQGTAQNTWGSGTLLYCAQSPCAPVWTAAAAAGFKDRQPVSSPALPQPSLPAAVTVKGPVTLQGRARRQAAAGHISSGCGWTQLPVLVVTARALLSVTAVSSVGSVLQESTG